MVFEEYLQPVNLTQPVFSFINNEEDCIGRVIKTINSTEDFSTLEDIDVAIIGINETRGAFEYYSGENGVDKFRTAFYSLKKHQGKCRIADLGNLKPGKTKEDTYFGLSAIIEELVNAKIIPVIIGGSQELTYAHYLAYKKIKQVINITSIDSRFDLGKPGDELTSRSYLGKIILEKPNYLFNFSVVGYQTYYVGQDAVELMKKLFFDTYRLGQIKTDITEVEPIIRNADLLSFDLSSIRHSDSPGVLHSSPNGFNGEEACQIMMYAGISDKLSGIGLYEYCAEKDPEGQTAALMAQMIWYLMEGFSNRKKELPSIEKTSFITYRVTVAGNDRELVFLKSKKSDRWWIEFPMPESRNFFSKQLYIPCSYKDYQDACNNEIPERWWQTFQKVS